MTRHRTRIFSSSQSAVTFGWVWSICNTKGKVVYSTVSHNYTMKQIMSFFITFITLMAVITMTFGMPFLLDSSNRTHSSTVIVNHGPWAEILENWVTNQSDYSRASRVLKVGDKIMTVSTKITTGNKKDISETDLYLLGAIEKLVYRVENVEKRLRRAEELLYYIITGNNNIKEPCPANYTRIGKNCYHFSNRDFDWKSSASLCRGMGGHLVEFDTIEESQDVIASLMSDSKLKGKNFWTGGINPGLLWFWPTSGRPVDQNTKQPVIGGSGCLKLFYDASSKIYYYKSENCGSRQRYICELTVDDESANKIERTARLLIDKNN